jgi:hypothetical protein
MGTNNKIFHDHQRTFNNTSPNKKYSSGSPQRPSPSKSINIKTPNKNHAGYVKNNNYNNSNNSSRLSLSGSPTTSYFAASKCFESPSPESLPTPPSTWMMINNNNNHNSTTTISSTTAKSQAHRVRKALIMPTEYNNDSCAKAFSIIDKNDHFTQSLKLLLNVSA